MDPRRGRRNATYRDAKKEDKGSKGSKVEWAADNSNTYSVFHMVNVLDQRK